MRREIGSAFSPMNDIDAAYMLPGCGVVHTRLYLCKAGQVIYPKAYRIALWHIGDLPGKSPTDADIAKVINDAAKNIE